MKEVRFMPEKWIAGWGAGKSGPSCPSDSPTVAGSKYGYIPVGIGLETVAIVVEQRIGGKSEMFNNAALIAAAPVLYELLAAADTLIIWESMGFTNEFADRVEAALAKARGES